MSNANLEFLHTLEDVIRQRAGSSPDGSYTAELFTSGTQRIAQKVGEEALELALAAVGGDREEQLNETADLLYHLLVLLAAKDLHLSDAVAVLQARHQQ